MLETTPMVRQYQEIKSRHKDAILFFRLGDFYEMFNDDAIVASKELDITLTGRGEGSSRMPMCGIPFHAADSYVAKLIGRGYKVAICEQVEDPAQAKGVVRRDVIKIVTPGTVTEPGMLDEKKSNWLASVSFCKNSVGIAVVDASTGEFRATQIKGQDLLEKLKNEIDRLGPAECLLPDIIPGQFSPIRDILLQKGILVTPYKDVYDLDVSEKRLKEHFRLNSLQSFGVDDISASLGAAAAIIEYLKDTQKTTLSHINRIQPYHVENFMFLDSISRRNLEITHTIKDRSFRGSLLWVLDQALTSMGSRLLANWVLEPLLNEDEIEERLDGVGEFASSSVQLRMELKAELEKMADLERLTGRVSTASANARDLVALKDSIRRLPKLKNMLKGARTNLIRQVLGLEDLVGLCQHIEKALVAEPPMTIKEGGMIADGFSEELDDLKTVSRGGKQWISDLEASERARTQIKSLKVGFTRVFGYYIEVTNSNLAEVPPDYIRKQTLANCERFITPALKEREAMILNAETRINELEYELFCGVREFVSRSVKELQRAARAVSIIDVLLSLALVAVQNRYTRPKILKNSNEIFIKDGRHPVVEKTLAENKFVPNDVRIGPGMSFLLITGPNMAGKSTYMRQTALIALMAQIGSFVPASEARLGLVDRIFTRIGAMDDIFSGQSTFMLEMTETANILNNATERSLVILDEIGRGTATFDGMSIAAAVVEYICEKIGAKTLFATHYHEITQLKDKHKMIQNLSVKVVEEGDRIIFLHKIVEGPADKSYGIQVAKLAGLPKDVIERAKEVYNTLEMVESDLGQRGKGPKRGKKNLRVRQEQRQQIGLF